MKKICSTILGLILVVVLFSKSPRALCQQEPVVYDGKLLSEWIGDLGKPAIREQAQRAVIQIGTNAIPFLLEETADLGKIWGGGISNFNNTIGAQQRYANLYVAFKTLGPIAKPAVPALITILNSDTNGIGDLAAFALVQIDKQIAAQALDQALTNNNSFSRFYSLRNIYYLGTNADIAVPNLIQCLKDKSSDKDVSYRIRYTALEDLILLIHNKPEQIVPVLVDELKDNEITINRGRSAQALGNLGKQAPQTTIPILTEMSTNDPDKNVRTVATTALQKIQAASP